MKAKSTNKLVSLALALFMLLMSVPFSMLATTARAEEAGETAKDGVHVLDAADLETSKEGDYKGGKVITAGADNFFTLYFNKDKARVDENSKNFDDGFKGTKRINFQGAVGVTPESAVAFKTTAPAEVKVWWVCGGDGRPMGILNASGEKVASTDAGVKKDAICVSTLKLDAAGQYFLGGFEGNNYIFKVEVTEEVAKEYVLDAADLETSKEGDYKGGKVITAGADNFFTLYFTKDKARVDENSKNFDDGFKGTKRINFQGAVGITPESAVAFKTTAPAEVKVWWVCGGDGRPMGILNASGEKVASTDAGVKKDAICVSTLKLDAAGQYFLGGFEGNNYIFKVTVTTGAGKVERSEWKDVADPVITGAEQVKDEDGNIKGEVKVTVKAVVGNDGGDKLAVTMYDKDGKEVETKNSLAEKDTHELTFSPKASGKYTFKAVLTRDGEETTKTSAKDGEAEFTLPLGTPTISSATSKGKGSDGKGTVEVVWTPVDEATQYEVFVDGTSKGKTDKTSLMVTGLDIGKSYKFTVKAIRGTEVGAASAEAETKTTEAAQMTWGTVYYGTSTDSAHNTVEGDLNADGKVTVASEGGKGKFQEGSNDGLVFYYTAIPSNKNFTLRAKMHVDTWTLSSGQEGAGLMALDCLPGTLGGKANSSDLFWSNCYRVGAQRFAYWYDAEKGVNSDKVGDKYQMNIGVGVQAKLGMTKDNIADVYKSASGIVEFVEAALEKMAVDKGLGAGTYATIGNCTNPDTFKSPAVAQLTDIVIELQRNNTGYFLTYYAADGKTIIGQQKYYEPKALDQLDPDNVYVGFCAARNMKATFSDVTLTTIDPKDDAPAEERPITKVEPTVSIGSSTIANSPAYTLLVKSNVVGKAEIIVGGKVVKTVDVSGTEEYATAVVTIAAGTNKIEVKFTPDKDQALPPYTQLSSTDPITKTVNVKYETYFEKQNNLYVSPKGTKGGNGGKEYPLDIYTAVSVVRPGQTIVLMEGTYNLESGVVIERGISGTADKMINMIADPEAKTRPVFNFGKKSTVKTAGILAVGDYWYFQGFDVTQAPDGTPGIMVSGNNCTFDNIKSYSNGDCGIYIRSRGNSADPKSLWPSNNTILNCTAYDNADAAGENADGFAAKFSVGKGNVFDGCVSYNNCDDGWDLYARGVSIEAVTLRNCIAYNNGHNIAGTIKGNGNGFKLGGENMPAGHTIINSIAFHNDANGITSNSCPDIKVKNCISFDNGSANVALYTGNSKLDTNFEVDGLISFRSDSTAAPAQGADVTVSGAAGDPDNIKPQGAQKAEDLQGPNNFFFDGSAAKSSDGKEITSDMFVTLEFTSVQRADNGMIDLNGFLTLKEDKIEEAFGKEFAAQMTKRFVSLDGDYNTEGTTTSKDISITQDNELPPPTGFGIAIVVAVIAISAAAAIVLLKKRKSSK